MKRCFTGCVLILGYLSVRGLHSVQVFCFIISRSDADVDMLKLKSFVFSTAFPSRPKKNMLEN